MSAPLQKTSLRIAVLSDLHAFKRLQGDKSPDPSHLCISEPENNPTQHPFSGLEELIDRESLVADLVLCPGDMTDKADPDGIKYVWQWLHRLGGRLSAELTTATAGNHDFDSRGITWSETSRDCLEALVPPFPLPDEAINTEYWGRSVAVIRQSNYRLAVLNSCSLHTSGASSATLDRGAITSATLQYLQRKLESSPQSDLNILLCHHHPQPHSELSLGEYDTMQRGQLLLDLLAEHGDWLVIHGHKHFPKLSYAGGGAGGPVVFAAASFSGALAGKAATRTRNQFHIIEVPNKGPQDYGLRGRVRSWYWAAGSGWLIAEGASTGLPREAGFGTRLHPKQIARQIADKMASSEIKTWNEISRSVPVLSYQLPQDFLQTQRLLEDLHGLRVIFDRGLPIQVGRKL